MELIDEIRDLIISEAHKYIKEHKLDLKKVESIDKPRHTNIDIYAGRDTKRSGDWFNIDDCFGGE